MRRECSGCGHGRGQSIHQLSLTDHHFDLIYPPTQMEIPSFNINHADARLSTVSAAPGNKTSYISALMSSQSRLLAFERSAPRFATLEKMLAKGQCRNVIPRRADFTDSDPHDPEFAKVTRM